MRTEQVTPVELWRPTPQDLKNRAHYPVRAEGSEFQACFPIWERPLALLSKGRGIQPCSSQRSRDPHALTTSCLQEPATCMWNQRLVWKSDIPFSHKAEIPRPAGERPSLALKNLKLTATSPPAPCNRTWLSNIGDGRLSQGVGQRTELGLYCVCSHHAWGTRIYNR